MIHEKIGTLDRFLEGLDHAESTSMGRNPRIEDEVLRVTVEGRPSPAMQGPRSGSVLGG